MDFELTDRIPYTDEYEDPLRPIKGALTDFVNDWFLRTNENEVSLLKTIYDTLTPVLDQYGLVLVFKGGNVMRLINRNLKKYLPPVPDEIIMDVFEPYLKQSDNDFTVFLDPNAQRYDELLSSLTLAIFEALDEVRARVLRDKDAHFTYSTLSNDRKQTLLNDLADELKVERVEIADTPDKHIVFEDKSDPRSDVLVYESTGEQYPIYNSLNTALEFKDAQGSPIKFNLVRSKVNFRLFGDRTADVGGELIDISIPHRDDAQMAKLDTTAKFHRYIASNVEKETDKEHGFTYYAVSLDYIIHDLENILFSQFPYPWDNEKYEKRLARLVYFVFLETLTKKPISLPNLGDTIDAYEQFIDDMASMRSDLANPNYHLQDIVDASVRIRVRLERDQMEQFIGYVDRVTHYASAVIQIAEALVSYLSGWEEVSESDVYELDVV